MKQLPFDTEEYSDESPAVGLVVLKSDETMEHELRHWLPDSVRLYHTRIPNDVEISQDSLHRMKAALPAATALLPETTDFKVIVYGCTSGTTVIGEQAVAEAIQSVFPNVQVSNPLTAVKARLHSLGAKRIALLTPYVPDVSAALITELESSGIEVVQGATFNESRDDQVARISHSSIATACAALAETKGIDAIFASCTNLRTYDLLQEPHHTPIISSNSSLAWHIQHLLRRSLRVGPS